MTSASAQTTKRKPLVDRLVDDISGAIVRGEIAPSAKVTEEQMAADFGVSRTPVREAVKRLAELGLIIVRPRSGLEVVAVDENDVREVTELRSHLEQLAMRLAIERMTLADMRGLQKVATECERLLDEGSRPSVFAADSRFHLEIARLSHNRYLLETLSRLDARVQLCRMFLCLSDAKVKRSVLFHRKILSAMKDADAAGAMRLLKEHIEGISI